MGATPGHGHGSFGGPGGCLRPGTERFTRGASEGRPGGPDATAAPGAAQPDGKGLHRKDTSLMSAEAWQIRPFSRRTSRSAGGAGAAWQRRQAPTYTRGLVTLTAAPALTAWSQATARASWRNSLWPRTRERQPVPCAATALRSAHLLCTPVPVS